ncbi:MAG: SDR family oxidoreductase, partial [Longimicrobiales bacterium]
SHAPLSFHAMEINGRVALVTGGAVRVGRALSLGLARAGADVVVHYHSSEDEAHGTVADIAQLGRRAVSVRLDLAGDNVAPAIRAAHDAFGRLDILVNSASTFERAPIGDITASDWDHVLAVNLRAPFLLARDAASLLRAARGTVVNIVDLSAFQAWPSFAHHSVSKAGLVQLTRVLARALAPEVRVNGIAPGTVLPAPGYDGEDYAGGRDRRVVEREGRPEDVVDALLYLVRSDFVTGRVLVADGGRMLL